MKKMIKTILSIFLMLVFIYLLHYFAGQIPQKAFAEDKAKVPDIHFDELEYDFGKIGQGDMAKHIFKFKNSGDDVLNIIKIKPT